MYIIICNTKPLFTSSRWILTLDIIHVVLSGSGTCNMLNVVCRQEPVKSVWKHSEQLYISSPRRRRIQNRFPFSYTYELSKSSS